MYIIYKVYSVFKNQKIEKMTNISKKRLNNLY